jgi:NSS family neurotransmitter:Na+ symporter
MTDLSPPSAPHASWSSRLTFLFATIGFSVGLGNIWRFPYLAGESGGGAFVLIYLICVALIGLPIVVAELSLGRRGGGTPITSFARLAKDAGASQIWRFAGWVAVIVAFLITSYYAVIAGWTLDYFWQSASGALLDAPSGELSGAFDALIADPGRLIFWQTVFLLANAIVVSGGLHNGIERVVSILMPLLLVLLIALAIYALTYGDAKAGLEFLFSPDWSEVTWRTWLDALGQAFFSVGVGMAALMTYGAYLAPDVSIPRMAGIICFADTFVAVIAGLAIFPFVFAFDLPPGDGPGLVFVTMPLAFAELTGGTIAATAFFLLLAIATLTSSIALFEVLVGYGEERGIARNKTIWVTTSGLWLVGLLSVFSFNYASAFYPLAAIPGFEQATMFGAIDRLTSNIGLPIGGLLICLFAGWVMPREKLAEDFALSRSRFPIGAWRFWLRFILPSALILMIVFGITG